MSTPKNGAPPPKPRSTETDPRELELDPDDDEIPVGYHVEYLWDPRTNIYREELVADALEEDVLERAEASYEAWREADMLERADRAAAEGDLEREEEPEPSFASLANVEDPLADLTAAVPCVVGRTAVESLAAAAVPYVWGQIVVSGTINLFAGGPSSGKSTLLFLLLAARSSTARHPIDVLGFPVAPAPEGTYSVLIEGEHGEKSTARKLLKSYDILDAPLDGLDRVVTIARKAVTVGSNAWRKIESLAARGLVSDIWLDTLARVSPPGKEANDETAQVALFDKLAKLIEASPPDAQPTIWIAAHTRKGGVDGAGSGRVELEDISGSAQRTGQCDTVVGVWGKRDKARTASFLKLREEPDEYPEDVRYTIHGTECVLEAIGGKKVGVEAVLPAAGGDGPAGRLVSFLRAHADKAHTISALRKAAGTGGNAGKIGQPHLEKMLAALVKSGRVAHTQEGDFEVYRWATPKPDPGE